MVYSSIKIPLNTPVRAVAVTLNLGKEVTVSSIYNYRSHEINEQPIIVIFQQFRKPVILTSYLISYREWRRNASNDKG